MSTGRSSAPIFPTTDWSLVEHCHDHAPDRRTRQEQLLAIYLPALCAYLRAAKRCRADEVEELVQEFAAAKLVGPSVIDDARRGRGRFRTFLLTVFQNYLTDLHRRTVSRERGQEEFTRRQVAAAGQGATTPDTFDVAWARSALNEAALRMRRHLDETGRAALWTLFERRVLVPTLQQVDPPPYDQVVAEYGFETATQACSAVVTARRMFARFLREVVGQYAEDEQAVEDELNDLRRIVAAAR